MSRTLMIIALVASTLTFAAPPAAAASSLVCPSGCAYASIQDAIDAAAPGDTIVVRPGAYAEALSIGKSLTLCSTTSEGTTCTTNTDAIIDGAGAIYPIFITADAVTLQGFTIQNPTFVLNDQVYGAPIDPSLVVVYGADDVSLLGNILQLPAAPLAPATSRWMTIGVNVAQDGADKSDRLDLSDNTFRDFVEAVGPDGTCANAPCRMSAINLWGVGASPTIVSNDMLLPSGRVAASGVEVAGIYGNAQDAIVRGNTIQAASLGSLYGVKGNYVNSLFEDNTLQSALHGLFLSGSGNTLRANAFSQNNEGLRYTGYNSQIDENTFDVNSIGIRVAAPNGAPEASNLVFRENVFSTNTRDFSVHSQVSNTAFDLRENDWGAYTADDIRLFIEDAGTGNTLDISCFIDEDGTTRVCPIAAIGINVVGASWPRSVTFRDDSTFPGSEFGSRAWTLPSGSSTASSVTLSLGPGVYNAALTVTDGEGFTSSATRSLVLSNNAPTLDLAASYALTEAVAFSLTLPGADADNDALTYTLLSGPTGANILNGALKWTPNHAQSGSHSVSIRVSDGAQTATDTTTLEVANVPVGATIGAIANLNLLETKSGTRAINANSPSGSPIALSMTSGPAGATFVDNGDGTATFSYAAPLGSAGTHPVNVQAVSEGITTTKSFNVVVTQSVGLTLTRTSAAVLQGSPGQTKTITGSLTNTGAGPDTFTITATNSRGWSIVLPGSIALDAGASAPVAIDVVIGFTGDASITTIVACSTASPTTCRTISGRVEVPILVTVEMGSAFGMLDTIQGSAKVTYLDGTNASGVGVVVLERHAQNLSPLQSQTSGTTDGTGTFSFVLDALVASLPGTHNVKATATRGAATATALTAYDVGP